MILIMIIAFMIFIKMNADGNLSDLYLLCATIMTISVVISYEIHRTRKILDDLNDDVLGFLSVIMLDKNGKIKKEFENIFPKD